MADFLSPSPEVSAALAEQRPVVALESSCWVQGLAWPSNWEAAQAVDEVVRKEGAVPAVTWVQEGRLHFGLPPAQLEAICKHRSALKLNVAELPAALVTGQAGATTVSAALKAGELLGLEVFATGGVGGVHRGWQQHPDVSADLLELARTPLLTVSAGVKCVLDVEATLEAMEALAISVYRFRTDTFPELFSAGQRVYGTRLEEVSQVAQAYRLSRTILGRGCLVVQEPPTSLAPKSLHKWLHKGLGQVPKGGKEVTPFLLQFLAKASNGLSVEINQELLVANAQLAARIAVELSRSRG